MRYLLFAFLILCSLPVSPAARAYTVTSQQVVQIDPTHTLYLLGFELGFLTHEGTLGTSTARVSTSSPAHSLGYTLLTDRGLTTKEGHTAAALLSQASSTKDGFYIPQGRNRTFTLAVLHAHTASSSASTMEVRHLPLTVASERKKRSYYFLSQAELAPFRTDRHATSTTVTSLPQ